MQSVRSPRRAGQDRRSPLERLATTPWTSAGCRQTPAEPFTPPAAPPRLYLYDIHGGRR